jgi:hypothetical protein
MTKLRASLSFLALAAGALALTAAAQPAAAYTVQFKHVYISSYQTGGSGLDDMPTPPSNLATPRPAQPGPLVIHKRLDKSTPLIQQAKPSAPPAKLNSIKAK